MESINKYRNKISKFLVLFIPFLIGFFSFPLALLGNDLSYMPGDLGDARFITYVLENGYQFIIGNNESFYSAPFFFPAKNVIAMSDNMMGHLPIYSFFRLIHFSREDALQLWWLSIFVLNYFISFFCFHSYSKNLFASILVAYIFTFSIVNLVQLNYLQINSKFLLPILFLNYFKWLTTKKVKHLNIFLIVFFIQLLLGIYYAIFMVVFIIAISFIHITLTKSIYPFKDFIFRFKEYRVTILLIFIVVVGSIFYLQPYIKVASESGMRTYKDIQSGVPELKSFISAHPATIWKNIIGFGGKYFPNNFWVHQYFPGIFPGLMLLSVLVVLFIKPKLILNYNLKLVLITFVIIFLISIKWVDEFSPLKFFYKIKLFGPISFASRIILVLDVVLLFIMVNLLTKVFSNKSRYLMLGLFVFLFIFIAIDNSIIDTEALVRVKKSELLARYEQLEKIIDRKNVKNKKIIAVVKEDLTNHNSSFILDAMLTSQTRKMFSINGYSSNAPAHADAFWLSPTRIELNNWCKINGIDSSQIIIIDSPFK